MLSRGSSQGRFSNARHQVKHLARNLSTPFVAGGRFGRRCYQKAVLHAQLDPKIAAGPVPLAFTDLFTLFFYFGRAAWIL
jgi:hypothetical protein